MRPPLSADDESLLHTLESRKPSELVPIFLELSRRQSARRRPADLVADLGRDPFVSASTVDLRTSVLLDRLALEAAHEFQAVLLSPLAPLGTCSLVSPTTQDRSVTTARNNEVVSDPTNVLAIECARRLSAPKSKGARHVRLTTLHQVVRPQRYPANKGWSQHFRLFALAEAGFASPDHAFEVDAMAGHASVFLRLLDLTEQSNLRVQVPSRRFTLHVADRRSAIGDRLETRLRAAHPWVPIDRRSGFASNYYDGVRLLIEAESPNGGVVQLGDVGLFDWMEKLTSNRRTRFVAAGLGIQLLALLFTG